MVRLLLKSMAIWPNNLRPPTVEELQTISEMHHLSLTDEEIEDFRELIAEKMGMYKRLAELEAPEPKTEFTDRKRVSANESDPHNAFVTRCKIPGADDGILSGMSVAVKDNIAVAGVEMTNGSIVLDGYVPTQDATVVDAVLNAGGTVIGKTNMDSWAVSGTGELNSYGPITNPHDSDYLAGGSSGGSAVAVVEGKADLALGTDQAGSIRVPSAWCGCVGLKPTFGLVPYTGAVGMGYRFDHVGPMARTVETVATAMDAITVPDEGDPRQGHLPDTSYRDGLDAEFDVQVGRLVEGFTGGEDAVNETVANALESFEDDTVSMTESSVPLHEDGPLIHLGVATESITANVRDEGVGRYARGFYDTQWLREFANTRRTRAEDFPPTLKLSILTGQYMSDRYKSYYHAKSQNLAQRLTTAYDEALSEVDVLAMPTTPVTPFEYEPGLSGKELVRHAQGKEQRGKNTMPFNMTGHPALSVPCGTVDGLPVGVMFVGRRGEDDTVLDVGARFEEAIDVSM